MQNSIFLSFAFFGLYVISIMVCLRYLRKKSPTNIVCGNALLTYFIALIFIIYFSSLVNFFSFSSIYWFLTLVFLMCFGAIYKSISLRMMAQLLNEPQKSTRKQALLETYVKEESYHNRIRILVEKKMISPLADGSYSLTKKGYLIAKRLNFIQNIFYIKHSG